MKSELPARPTLVASERARSRRRVPSAASTSAALFALTLLLGAFACAPASTDARDSSAIRHVILITLDTLRADKTTPYGCTHDTTPNLARFAREGRQFERAYTAMPTTGPAHISIFTGLYPEEHGSLRNGIPARAGLDTLPELLRRGGRKTAAFVSALHLSQEATGIAGFETWSTPKGVRDGARTVDLATQWIGKHRSEPFFLWVHLFDPHAPYESHAGLADELEQALIPYQGVSTRGSYLPGEAVMPKEEAQKRELLYEADVFYTDQQVGRLLDFLDTQGIGERDLVIIAADHGELMTELLASEKYAFDHGEHLLPGEIRVPLWIKMPGVAAGSVEKRVVETKDLFGTILQATNTPAPRPVETLPIETKPRDAPPPRAMAFVTRHVDAEPKAGDGPLFGAADADALTIWSGAPSSPPRLYDLVDDPLALMDVRDARSELAQARVREIDAWRKRLVPLGDASSPQGMSDEMKRTLDALGY